MERSGFERVMLEMRRDIAEENNRLLGNLNTLYENHTLPLERFIEAEKNYREEYPLDCIDLDWDPVENYKIENHLLTSKEYYKNDLVRSTLNNISNNLQTMDYIDQLETIGNLIWSTFSETTSITALSFGIIAIGASLGWSFVSSQYSSLKEWLFKQNFWNPKKKFSNFSQTYTQYTFKQRINWHLNQPSFEILSQFLRAFSFTTLIPLQKFFKENSFKVFKNTKPSQVRLLFNELTRRAFSEYFFTIVNMNLFFKNTMFEIRDIYAKPLPQELRKVLLKFIIKNITQFYNNSNFFISLLRGGLLESFKNFFGFSSFLSEKHKKNARLKKKTYIEVKKPDNDVRCFLNELGSSFYFTDTNQETFNQNEIYSSLIYQRDNSIIPVFQRILDNESRIRRNSAFFNPYDDTIAEKFNEMEREYEAIEVRSVALDTTTQNQFAQQSTIKKNDPCDSFYSDNTFLQNNVLNDLNRNTTLVESTNNFLNDNTFPINLETNEQRRLPRQDLSHRRVRSHSSPRLPSDEMMRMTMYRYLWGTTEKKGKGFKQKKNTQ